MKIKFDKEREGNPIHVIEDINIPIRIKDGKTSIEIQSDGGGLRIVSNHGIRKYHCLKGWSGEEPLKTPNK